jgi:RimJ/RimL family protein N-acetyltransferase
VNRLFEPDTPRLRLRQWRPSDFAPFATMNADPRVMEFFPSRLDAAASDAMAMGLATIIAARGWGFWAVEVKASGAFAGFVGLNVPTAALPFGPCVEVGWRLAAEHWGRGYATEAAREALRVGFEELGLDEIVSFTVPANERSQAVMRRLGMTADPQRFEHPALPPGHPLREHCLYRMSRERWLAGR